MAEKEKSQRELDARLRRAVLKSAEAVRSALAAGADPNAEDENGQTALFALINAESQDKALTDEKAYPIVKALLDGGANEWERGWAIWLEDCDRSPAINCVAHQGWPLCARALLEAGADPMGEDTMGIVPLDELGYSDAEPERVARALAVARVLVEFGADIDDPGGFRLPPLTLALMDVNEPLIEGLLELGADPHWRCDQDRGALHALAGAAICDNELGSFSQTEAAGRLAERFMALGLSPTEPDAQGKTPLDFASGSMRARLLAAAESEGLKAHLASDEKEAPAGRRPRV